MTAGATPGGLEAWLALRGLRTLPVRIERMQATALLIAERLRDHAEVIAVHYPGLPTTPGTSWRAGRWTAFGTMLALQVKGGSDQADALCNSVLRITHATSLGGVETLIENRAAAPGEEHLPEGLLQDERGVRAPRGRLGGPGRSARGERPLAPIRHLRREPPVRGCLW